jgi:hypothetical protein
MSTPPLSLSNEQLQAVAAARAPRDWRRRFFDNVVDLLIAQLVVNCEITDDDVERAVAGTLKRIGVPVPAEATA